MQPTTPEMTVRAYWQQVWCQASREGVEQLYDPAARLNGEAVDRTEFAASVARWFVKFPDFTATVDELLVFGDRVVSRVTYRGTHRDTWAGLPATGKSFSAMGLDVFRVTAGRITEHWHATDHLELVEQLGGRVVPDVQQAAPR